VSASLPDLLVATRWRAREGNEAQSAQFTRKIASTCFPFSAHEIRSDAAAIDEMARTNSFFDQLAEREDIDFAVVGQRAYIKNASFHEVYERDRALL